MRTRTLVLFLAVGLSTLVTTTVFGADVLSGTWKVNLDKSTFSPGPPPRGPNTAVFQAVDNGLKVVLDGVDEAGRKTRAEFTAKFDGMDYPVTLTLDGAPVPNLADAKVSAKKIDDYTVEFTNKFQGVVVGQTKLVIAKDGKTHTATQTGLGPQGPVANTIFLEKQ